MPICRPKNWLIIGTLLAVALIETSVWASPRAIAQERNTPTRPPPPPTRTMPPGPRTISMPTLVPPTPVPTAAPGEQPTATPEASPVMPVTGASGPGSALTLFSMVLIGLGMSVLAWSLIIGRHPDRTS